MAETELEPGLCSSGPTLFQSSDHIVWNACDENKVLKITKTQQLWIHNLKQYVKSNDFECVKLSLLSSLNLWLLNFQRLSSSLFTCKIILCETLHKTVNYLGSINWSRSAINLIFFFFLRKREERNFKQPSNTELL